MIIIWTDGSSRGNPGPGGWGAIVATKEKVVEIGGREEKTTNNRMEMIAVIEALAKAEGDAITVHTDSSYVRKGITTWIRNWERNNWMTQAKKPVQNADLWQKLNEVIRNKKITWELVPGHSGVPGNMRCDEIATAFADDIKMDLYQGSRSDYPIDVLDTKLRYEKPSSKAKNPGKAYSYVSEIGGVVEIHTDWASCEKRVKGKKARFKKAFSKEDEENLVKQWRK